MLGAGTAVTVMTEPATSNMFTTKVRVSGFPSPSSISRSMVSGKRASTFSTLTLTLSLNSGGALPPVWADGVKERVRVSGLAVLVLAVMPLR